MSQKNATQKYYMSEVHLEFEIRDYPRVFPGYLLFSPELIRIFQSELSAAMLYGFDPKIRKICFTAMCKEGFSFEDILIRMQDYDKEGTNTVEITEQEFNIRSSIPHWNPINDAIQVLKIFIETMTQIQDQNKEVKLEEVMNEVNKVTSRAKEIFQPSTPGIIIEPKIIEDL